MPDPKFTPASGAKFCYQTWPDGRDGFNMKWWLEAPDGDEKLPEIEPAASEQEARQQAHIVASQQGFVHLFRHPQ